MATTRERLYEAMAYNGLRPIDLAERSGLGRGAISQYLSGKVNPKQDKIFILAKALNVSASWLMGKDVQMKDSPAGGPGGENITAGRDILKALFKSSPKAMALIDKMQVTDSGDVSISGVDMASAEVITHALRGVMYALSMAQVTDDGKLEAVISLDAIFPPKKDG